MKTIDTLNVRPKNFVRNGVERVSDFDSSSNYNASITPGKSIRIYGLIANCKGVPQSFDRTFKVGDEAEYDSYNFDYTGAILSIGPKSVTIKKESSTRSVRLDLHAFCWRNWNFDAAKTAAKNLEVMATI